MPPPTRTTSTGFMRMAMVCLRALGPVLVSELRGRAGEAQGLARILEVVLVDQAQILRVGSWEADHAPRDHVAIAAIGRIAEEALDGVGEQGLEEHRRGQGWQLDVAGL